MKKSLLVAVAMATVFGFGSSAWADVLMGVAGPITGPGAAFGAQLQRGAKQAVDDINASGGMNGEKITLEIGDDVADPKQGISVANKFVADGIKFVVGHYNSGVSIPASDVYAENGILQVSPSSINPDLTDRGLWNVFRTCGRADQQGAVASSYLLKHFKDAKIAFVHNKTPVGQGMVDAVRKQINAGGLQDVAYEGINVGDKDFSALVSKLKQDGVSLVYYGGDHTEAALITRQMADQGMKANLMAGDAIATDEFAAIVGDAADGTLMTFPPDPRQNPAASGIVKKFRESGFEPESYTLYSYAAVQVIAAAANAAGTNDPAKVAEAIKAKGAFKTVIGDLSYDSKGDITRADYIVYKWKKGDDGKYTYFPTE
ncbi:MULTISPECIES: branched-chain amino acid ABC transporter substrate-binding protein [unclassified Mesorhizobium]|uniref:branched-chain amino acid ABC transporter substrate-binding protein n=1 Tax=unclassified Mesorhizobium TaxID=325217 RepID=UPI0024152227|nr:MULTISPECIES: branched-chain amino acid ABC transporter substrate-binding protein [unclassified Mesorhizobium]MDG4890073.1 branched-chain amino acid ABC transporter substrate-binding protein [Mesorhizobium sp. WSM4887]MDG4904215.1 branched-chain amino acid ABC transporter substrate-binding protein [Mesorhizobium sp. WSM4962]MDG4909242.1 branched-chain amino acid ABC transporter substrate-binding protein [Mesorhizobium sp. WSM4898]MDG4921866.1 branched-chain amino acid ABC transporter substra